MQAIATKPRFLLSRAEIALQQSVCLGARTGWERGGASQRRFWKTARHEASETPTVQLIRERGHSSPTLAKGLLKGPFRSLPRTKYIHDT